LAETELDILASEPTPLKFSTGFQIEVVRLRTRQVFRLLKVLTQGAGPALGTLDFKADAGEFMQRLLALVIISIPEAENAAIGFLASMCRPAGVVESKDRALTKQEKENNQALWVQFNEELNNPEPDDTIDLIEAIITREAPHLQALGKRITLLVSTFTKTGQDKEKADEPPSPEELNSPPESSPEPSPEPSIS
jgi:hypothetical protein